MIKANNRKGSFLVLDDARYSAPLMQIVKHMFSTYD